MKKFLLGLSVFIVILAAVTAWAYQKINAFVEIPVQTQPDQLLVLERGTTGNKLAALFEQEKLVDDAKLLPWLLKLRPDLNKVTAGT